MPMVLQHPSISSSMLRKFFLWFSLIFLMVYVPYYFIACRNYALQNNLKAEHTLEHVELGNFSPTTPKAFDIKNNEEARSDIIHVLLVAYTRTGSTFVAEMMHNILDSFYDYEPLRFMQNNILTGRFGEARNYLNNIFSCNFSGIEGFLEWSVKRNYRIQIQRNLKHWERCTKTDSCYNGTYIDNFCHNHKIRVIKIVRLNLLEASKLFDYYSGLNLKIIYLVRDPRGVMNSRSKNIINEWCINDMKCSKINNFCSDLKLDSETICFLSLQRPKDFLPIRYEDVCADPYGFAEKLTKFLGFRSVPEEIYKFLQTHTKFGGNTKLISKATGLEYSYTTYRNSTITAVRWRKELTFKHVTAIQRSCKAALSAFGYHFYRAESEMKSDIDFNIDFHESLQKTCNAYLT